MNAWNAHNGTMPLISSKCKRILRSNRFALYTVLGVVAGISFGLFIRNMFWPGGKKIDYQLLRYMALPGAIYMRLFILIIAPLLMTSLALSFFPAKTENPFDKQRRFTENPPNYSSEGVLRRSTTTPHRHQKRNRSAEAQKLIIMTFILFGTFSLLASVFGACLMLTFGSFAREGGGNRDSSDGESTVPNFTNMSSPDEDNLMIRKNLIIHKYYQMDTIYNIFLNIFPNNLITPFFMSSFVKTQIIWPANLSDIMDRNYVIRTHNETLINYKTNMLSLCILSLFFGVILQKLGAEKTKNIRAILYEMDNIIKYILKVLMKCLPIGMFCWMFAESLKMDSMLKMAVKLAYFYTIVIGAFFFWLIIFYPIVYVMIVRENPFKLYKNILSAIVIAFGSCSSAVTLPETMRCMREKCSLSSRVCQAVLPLGMTVHMNGPAMYFPMTAIFVALIKEVPLEFSSVIVLCLFSVIMSMGLPPVIGTGTLMLNHMAFASVLGVDDPQDILAYVLAFEWILERIRTSTNIIGDCFVAKIIERICHIHDDDFEEHHDHEDGSEEKL